MDEQICHLKYDRIIDTDHNSGQAPRKIGGTDIGEVQAIIDRAVKRVQLHLSDESKHLWAKRSTSIRTTIGAGEILGPKDDNHLG